MSHLLTKALDSALDECLLSIDIQLAVKICGVVTKLDNTVSKLLKKVEVSLLHTTLKGDSSQQWFSIAAFTLVEAEDVSISIDFQLREFFSLVI